MMILVASSIVLLVMAVTFSVVARVRCILLSIPDLVMVVIAMFVVHGCMHALIVVRVVCRVLIMVVVVVVTVDVPIPHISMLVLI